MHQLKNPFVLLNNLIKLIRILLLTRRILLSQISLVHEGVSLLRVQNQSDVLPSTASDSIITIPEDVASLLNLIKITPRFLLDSVLALPCNQTYMLDPSWTELLCNAYYSCRCTKDMKDENDVRNRSTALVNVSSFHMFPNPHLNP
jgi:hypothetical protein